MLRKTMNKGLGLAALSLLAGLLMSGAVLAQDAGDGPDVVIDDGEVILVIDDGMFVVDPICIECVGEVVDGDDGSVGDDWVDDGWVDDGAVDDGWTGEADPQIHQMSGGPAPEMEHRGVAQGLASHRAEPTQPGLDLCASPAVEVVWLCELVNGKSE